MDAQDWYLIFTSADRGDNPWELPDWRPRFWIGRNTKTSSNVMAVGILVLQTQLICCVFMFDVFGCNDCDKCLYFMYKIVVFAWCHLNVSVCLMSSKYLLYIALTFVVHNYKVRCIHLCACSQVLVLCFIFTIPECT